MPNLITKFLGAYFRSGVRGSSRLTEFLSQRMPSMHAVPFETNGGVVFGDMRMPIYRGLLVHRRDVTEEEIVMKQFVRPGDTAFDIGVFWGVYTAFLSTMVGPAGHVHSFEPNSILHSMLNMTAEKLGNVKVHPVALSDRTGEVDFFVPVHDGSMASLENWTGDTGWEVNKITCQMRPLDDVIAAGETRHPDFIKCDVEGAEIAVFRGAVNTLDREDAPVVLFEVNPSAMTAFGASPDETVKFLQGLDKPTFRFYQIRNGGFVEIRDAGEVMIENGLYTNVVAVPATRQESMVGSRR
jgi:FkbM family methyltransferase